MKINFKGIKFDYNGDPIAVFESRKGKRFFFHIEIITVKYIVEILKKDNISVLKNNIYFSLIKDKNFKIEEISIREYRLNNYFGEIILSDSNKNYFKYTLIIDDIVLFSIYFNSEIVIRPSVFYKFLDNTKILFNNNSKSNSII